MLCKQGFKYINMFKVMLQMSLLWTDLKKQRMHVSYSSNLGQSCGLSTPLSAPADRFFNCAEGCCHTNTNQSAYAQPTRASGGKKAAPLGESGGA
jgi:hypothetical protein